MIPIVIRRLECRVRVIDEGEGGTGGIARRGNENYGEKKSDSSLH
jgi:hypothetical protein